MSDDDPIEATSDDAGGTGSTDGGAQAGGEDAMRQAAQELLHAARSFLDAAERTLADDETVQRWADRGQDLVRGFLTGLTADPSSPRRPDDDDGIEHIPVD